MGNSGFDYISEKQVIAKILDDYEQNIKKVKAFGLNFEKFADPVYRVVMRTSEKLDDFGVEINVDTIFKEIEETHNKKTAVAKIGLKDLIEIKDSISSSQDIENLIAIVLKNAAVRDNEFKKEFEKSVKRSDSIDFPMLVVSGVAGKFARLYSKYLEPPIEFFYFAFLTILGVIISDKIKLESELLTQPRLFTLILGESADTRKTTAIDKTIDFFIEFVHRLIDEVGICRGVNSAEGLIKEIKAIKGDEKDPKRLLLCYDEFRSFVNKCKIESSVLLQSVTTLFESNYLQQVTKKSSIKIKNANLSILAASTINTYSNMFTSAFTDIGFNNRLFIVPGEGMKKHPIPKTIPEDEKKLIAKDLAKLLATIDFLNYKVKLTAEAEKIYFKWYMNLENSIHAKRIDSYALRFILLLAVNDFDEKMEDEIIADQEIIEKVIAICNWQLAVRQLYDPIDCDNVTAALEESIRRNLSKLGPLTEGRLKSKINAWRYGNFLFERAKSSLLKSKEIVFNTNSKCFEMAKGES